MGKLQSYAMFLCQLWVSGCCSSFAVWVKRVWQVVAGRSRSCNYRSFSVNRRCAGRKPRLQAESGATSLQATFGKKSLCVFLVPCLVQKFSLLAFSLFARSVLPCGVNFLGWLAWWHCADWRKWCCNFSCTEEEAEPRVFTVHSSLTT